MKYMKANYRICTNKKIVLFFLQSGVGGAERITVRIARMLPEATYEPIFVVVGREVGPITKFIPSKYRVIHIKLSNIWQLGTLRIFSLIKSIKPATVFCSSMYLNARVCLAAHILGNIRIILRNCNYMSTQRFDKTLLCRFTYPFADVIVSQQDDMTEDILRVLGVDNKKIFTLHNPIDTETIQKCLDINDINPYEIKGSINYTWVGRFTRAKGQDLLVDAFKYVHEKNPNSHLYMVGKFNEEDDYYKLIKKKISIYGLTKNVHISGFDSNPYKWIKYSDCFVLPSRIEGLPNTLIEAQYLGKPCAATRCIPIIERIVIDGETGFTAESQNPCDLAEAMIKAVKLKRIVMKYKPATDIEFVKLFEQ